MAKLDIAKLCLVPTSTVDSYKKEFSVLLRYMLLPEETHFCGR